MSGTDTDSGDGTRAQVRAFVRTHHPDVGGDPVAFREGLADLRARQAAGPGPYRLAPDDPRLDAPVVAVSGRRLARLGRLGHRLGRRLARRYDPRPGSARVQ